MISNFNLKQFTKTSINNFVPKSIDFRSLHCILSNQFPLDAPFKSRFNDHKFLRHFSKSFNKSKIETLKEKSNLGDLDAQFELGSYYLSSNNEEGIQYIKNAAEHKHIFACYTYSKYLKDGHFVKQNINESLKFLTYAADHDLEIAQFKLAVGYFTGECFPQDTSKALHYFCLSAANGNVSSCKTAGTLLLQGIGCKYDMKLAIKYFQIGSSLNCAFCKHQLSIIYSIDNKNESIRLLKESADLGYYIAQREYGDHLLLEKNKKEAAKYFRLAAEQNDAESCFKLSELLKESDNTKESLLLLNKAAELGHEVAILRVGKVCEKPSSSFDYPLITNLDLEKENYIENDEEYSDSEEIIDDESDFSLKLPKHLNTLNLSDYGILQC